MTEVRNKYLTQSNESSLTSLSDYLRQLDNTRQELITVLKDTVSHIAEKVKKV